MESISEMSETVTVRAYHNSATAGARALLDGFTEGDAVTLVAQFELDLKEGPTGDLACHCVFGLLNIGNDPDFGPTSPDAVAYFTRGNRALSVGDVIEFPRGPFAGFYAVDRLGFRRIEPPRLVRDLRPGTVPFDPSSPDP
jgi:hypothetical protein